MALDTVRLRSPSVTEAVAACIENQLVTRSALDRSTGELLYELTAGQLQGSFDHKIQVAVRRQTWVGFQTLEVGEDVAKRLGLTDVHKVTRKTREPLLVPCEPYLEIEGSVHKAMLGHNVHGGPCDPAATFLWFIDYVGCLLGVEMPDPLAWLVLRVDWAEAFRMSYEAVELYMLSLGTARFPLRKGPVGGYAGESVWSSGSTTGIKFYHKGPEFSKHDYKRLRVLGKSEDNLMGLQSLANELLRVETTVKGRKLEDDFKHPPTVGEITEAYLVSLHEREVARLVKEGSSDMKTVRQYHEVHDRLFSVYEGNQYLAGLLFGTWLQLATVGEHTVKASMAPRTFYRQRKQLQAAGVSWHGADVRIVPTAQIIPAGFAPVHSDSRRLRGEDPRVVELLAPYRDRKEVA